MPAKAAKRKAGTKDNHKHLKPMVDGAHSDDHDKDHDQESVKKKRKSKGKARDKADS